MDRKVVQVDATTLACQVAGDRVCAQLLNRLTFAQLPLVGVVAHGGRIPLARNDPQRESPDYSSRRHPTETKPSRHAHPRPRAAKKRLRPKPPSTSAVALHGCSRDVLRLQPLAADN